MRKLDSTSGSLLERIKKLTGTASKESTIYFPSSVSALTSVGGLPLWHMTVVEPISATRSSIRRTLYATKPNTQIPSVDTITSELETEFNNMVKKLETQFHEISSGTESLSLSTSQEELREQIHSHVKKEREAGKRITPALPLQISSEVNGSNCGIAERRKRGQ